MRTGKDLPEVGRCGKGPPMLKVKKEERAMMENKNTARPRGTDSAKVIQVIVTESLRGVGTRDDLSRLVTQYWDFDGNLLAEHDPVNEILEDEQPSI